MCLIGYCKRLGPSKRQLDRFSTAAFGLAHRPAASLAPLVKKYDLQCRAALVLSQLGAAEARADGRQTWQSLLRHSVDTYPTYVMQFRELAALAPVVDRPFVELLTQHEVLLISWLTTELGSHAEGHAWLSTGMTAVADLCGRDRAPAGSALGTYRPRTAVARQ